MPVGFDSTIVSVLLNPKGRVPNDPTTGAPVELAKERVQALIVQLQKEKQKVIIPTPVTAEILTVVGPTSAEYLQVINRSRVFEVRPFDEVAAIELAFMNRDIFAESDKRNGLEPYQKIKIDRQILAICRAAQCETLYTDDKGLANRARLCEIKPVGLSELPIPDSARQGKLALEQHEELPELEEDDAEPSE